MHSLYSHIGGKPNGGCDHKEAFAFHDSDWSEEEEEEEKGEGADDHPVDEGEGPEEGNREAKGSSNGKKTAKALSKGKKTAEAGNSREST
eukprot:CAMPEP_0194036410 /NCGR_PEP_ID=MMETSP0009_2-20130614/8748_1 /TAXON_ID=210454 /ORGANISM="Grammatophora oceanica, Strain CCMP 410" /LENGTH=89 /DNA_ID=CAMNT_0038678135 /DNA_START=204 /DNA_END=470 /DNA_ORIENTATION=+